MATKVTTGVIDSSAITSALIANASITADDLHATLDLTGKTVTVATASAGDNDTSVASTAFVSTAIANLADSAPSTLDTLNELAAALGDDANFSTTVTDSIALKAPLASPSLTGTVTVTGASSAYNTLQLTSNSTGHGTIINLGDTSDANYGSITQFASSAGEGGRMRFVAGTTETMNLRGGKVGIGTNNPAAAKLDIVSADNSNTIAVVNIQNNMDNSREALRITSLGDYDAHMGFRADGATDYWGGFGIDYSDAGKFKLQTDNILSNGTNLMTWARDNKVGIGTTNPSAHLHIDVANPTIKLGAYSFITEDIENPDSLGLWTHTSESILFGQTADNLTNRTVTCRIDNNGILRPTRFRLPAGALPTSALSVGELHVDTGDSNKVKSYNGSAWVDTGAAATISATAPSSPAQGDMWFNSSASTVSTIRTKSMAVWNGTAWASLSDYFSATGGTITTSGIYKIHTFTSSGTFTAATAGTVDVFLVGGGGCGGVDIGGGGGAGGVITSASRSVAAGTHSIVVGAGGPSRSGNEGGNNNYDKGTNTTAFSLTALAGGAGGQEYDNFRDGDSGGSGGGAGYLTYTGGAGTSGQGNAGGNSSNGVCGGGGGYSQAGAAGVSGGAGGAGGDGLQNNYDGNNDWYAGGGGGNSYGGSISGAGGRGGGGGAGGASSAGATNPGAGGIGRNAGTAGGTKVGGAGGVNTGGGGGGGSEGNGSSFTTGGAGGSGIVIVRYIP